MLAILATGAFEITIFHVIHHDTPRQPLRPEPRSTRIEFDSINPYGGSSSRGVRYETYKSATTVGEARSLGAQERDLEEDILVKQVAELILEEEDELVMAMNEDAASFEQA